MDCTSDALARITGDVCSSLGLGELSQAEALAGDEPHGLHAMVAIRGEEDVRVLTQAPRALAQALVLSMTGNLGNDDMLLDGIAEFCNQIAGGVKGLLSGENALCVPIAGAGPALFEDTALTGRSTLRCSGLWETPHGVLSVSVWAAPAEA